MPNDRSTHQRPAPEHVTALLAQAEAQGESEHFTAKRVRRNRVHGSFALPGGTSQPWFDQTARDLMRLLATDPNVLSFQSRPGKMFLPIDGDRHEHTPDFRVNRKSEVAIVDIERPRTDSEGADKYVANAIQTFYAKRGLRYTRIARETIYLQPRFANACEILRFKSVELSAEFNFKVFDLISSRGGATNRADLEDALGGRDKVLPLLYAMALQKLVLLDLSKPLSRTTQVSLLAKRVAQ